MSNPESTGLAASRAAGQAAPRRNGGWVYTDVVDGAARGWTALHFYARRYPHSSTAAWAQRLGAGQVLLDGGPCDPHSPLRPGQRLEYRRPPWTEPPAPRHFDVVWDDGDVLAVAKPSGLPVLPAAGFLENTLLHAVRERLTGEPAPLHRLDRGASGLVLFARSAAARRGLCAALGEGRVGKVYRALVQGVDLQEESFTVEAPIGRVAHGRLGEVFAAVPEGKPSRTQVRLLERRRAQGACLVEVTISTGRPHQIRIHLAAAGHPLVGEGFYGAGGAPRPPSGARPALPGDAGYHLHAARVAFTHPLKGSSVALWVVPPGPLRIGAGRRG